MYCEPRPRVLEGSECNPFREPHNEGSNKAMQQPSNQEVRQQAAAKPALPPKPGAAAAAAAVAAVPVVSDSLKEEKDRDSEPPPEGSVDQSPTYSESVQSERTGTGGGTAGGGTGTTGTPAYVRWAESVQSLLDDTDGFQLFKQYLVQQCLDHLLMF